ncbi:MAG: putative nicotinate-nucleotide adenylyltransferase [Firmicutes bacterium]|nr:putative nicotinate-nucleotide adenylyltransferase [candidate division NPL-UPA2 bacterium]MBT9154384.1 putative nicotinate-nucleotide adenylyltransferase [candidate division NPL-UPA2 bacterium]MBT9155951.1 putative nicotinate-nucleotide adenylyltransferase [candidate division NPL-UPA2 bacterium]
MRIGVMGGTFDPIHLGHLVTAEAVRHRFGLQQVVFVPTGRPPHKRGNDVSSAEHRYVMTFLAVLSNPEFGVSRIEIDRLGYSYTFDTMLALGEMYGPDCELYFITGADVMRDIHTWHRAPELLTLCHFVAASRPDYTLCERFRQGGHIHLVEVPAMAISSTDLRRRVRAGEPIRYLVPEAVENYIYEHRLYLNGAR